MTIDDLFTLFQRAAARADLAEARADELQRKYDATLDVLGVHMPTMCGPFDMFALNPEDPWDPEGVVQ